MNDRFTLALTGQSLIKHDIRDIRTPAFQDVQSLLRQADLSFTNFEGTILGTHGGWPLKGSFFGCSDPAVLDALGAIGFQALSLSNNHAFDLGPSGVLSTLEEVEKRGFLHAGLGRNAQEVSRASIATINQRRIALVAMDGGPGPDFMYAADADENRPERPGVNRLRLSQLLEVDDLAFEQIRAVRDKIGYTAIDLANDSQPDDPPRLDPQAEVAIARCVFKRSNRYGRGVRIDEVDMARNLAAIASAARDEALVIAYLHHHHWASDWYQLPEWVSGVAKRCIDAGASMFVSHGAPVLQPVEIYRGRPIFYSLGNFIFHVRSEKSTWTAAEVWESVVGVCSFASDNSLIDISFHPVVIGGDEGLEDGVLERRLVPQLVTGDSAVRILGRLQEQSARLGAHIEISGNVGRLQAR
ncbi:capsule biosynthesis protein CapA [Sinorhizobium medicae]|uniref:CapA family protein n=1 Tax=Sinorhizobium medicae TaxID=110321 RepID=UPI000FDB79DF|nr:CapA family protein [Sinorhizobium medicae]MDX0411638.1 capsule biosynthesis protein CapA [Sinorhizobium medicae]MDX0475244.1 capsule biosynthesis protein CapA [Sinorhizobium medicae]MDX0537041.1 capsule biosynthesis protein CapA [Sinorhizobium medicae]MDX0667453.1 capsule biosynthesis protein CapA [Sinorhizobium medicae]MDX0722702.1 capsule biosynthesis protein CapA [Sinorhizobium medicae]